MATPAEKQQQTSGLSTLSSSTVLDAVNLSGSEDVSDQDTDSDIEQLECDQDQGQGEPTSHAGLRTGSESIEGEMSSSMSSTSAPSLLNVLRAPRPSDLTRK